MSYEGYQEALESERKKEDELSIMKQQFDSMQSQMQALLSALRAMDQPSENELAKVMVQNGIYKKEE